MMDDKTMEKEWEQFAKSINGTIHKSTENYFDHDNTYKISTDLCEIELTWGNQPQKGRGPYITLETKIRFNLIKNGEIDLKVIPANLFSKFLSSLSNKRQKFGIKELDDSCILRSNSLGIAFELTELFKEFYQFNKYKNFVIETESISNNPVLTIFIPELVTTYEKLTFYYNFGLKLSKKISVDNYRVTLLASVL